MRRPPSLLRGFLLLVLLFLVGEYVALTHLAPRYVLQAVQHAAGGEIVAAQARLSFPLTTTLQGLRLVNNTPQSALTIQRAAIWPRWLSLPSRTLWLDAVELDRPILRLTRTHDGTFLWPNIPQAVTTGTIRPRWGFPSTTRATPVPASWQVRIDSIKVVDGVIELVDEKSASPFHGVLDHLSLIAGPLTVPLGGSPQLSFAIRGQAVGHGGHAAPFYCSGWLNVTTKDLQATCRLEPLALAAFEPYYQGSPEVRVYAMTLASTSHWMVRANTLSGRIQLELGRLGEGDLSIRGRTVLDVKHIAGGPTPRLSGEITLAGPLDDPRRWRAEFSPGDDQMQQLVTRLLDHGIQMIKILLWGGEMRISLVPASKEAMANIEAASKEIQEALEILAVPLPEEAPFVPPAGEPPSGPAAPEPTPESPAASPPAPSVLPELQASSPSSSPAGAQPQGLAPTSPANTP
ncbi:MAG: DUF748 domain-containing protein [Candidatus Omnitrophica bacterium]|nr:DUF748 domain-containing protein [Candidatus Omnitrophota bacterium]MBI2496016.1 DUF748 domain-containing protein [Candidatus Omnitrophota bacterium]MBI3020947.1 DUF748 domain-containing protein [Candidatus Omnitrophota bacterium]